MSNTLSSYVSPEELRRLISAWCDGVISEDDFTRLKTTLASDPQSRAVYLAYMNIQAGVHAEAATLEYLNSVSPNLCELGGELEPPSKNRSFPKWKLAAACVTVVVAGGLALKLMDGGLGVERPSSARTEAALDSSDDAKATDRLARIIRASKDCEWSLDHAAKTQREVIRSGDMIRVANGVMTLKYDNGSILTLHGPALFEVMSEDCGRILLGKLTAKIAKGAEGFAMLTPRAKVIDLGTEFGIEVDRVGATDVVVFEGLVDLAYTSRQRGRAPQRRLSAGEGIHLDAYGTASRIVSISDQRFSGRRPDASPQSRANIITAVRDNIQRDQGWNFYEIVHEGMGEDARAFVDRDAHEWNGVDERGMPKYLLGGDYVKTFNNDKCRKEIEIVVTLARPCRLYLLFDDRIDPPQWLRRSFRDTGDNIGVDDGPWVYNGVPSKNVFAAVGAGKSIDDEMSIWVRDVESAGPITLGATETPHDDLNMYGIVAVPLPMTEKPQPK
jgi:hypothetical protein